MGIMTNRNARSGQLAFLLLAFACLAMFQPGCSKVQDIDQLRQAAEQGDAEAQNKLGVMYLRGEGVPENNQEAAKWCRKAAEQGHAPAQNNLGFMYSTGEGVPQDDKEAAKWYRKAAEQGHAKAQSNLGGKYARGEGVPQDDKEAAKWYRKAAEQGHAPAQNKLGFMYSRGEGVPENNQEAVKWYRKAAEQGDAPGQLGLGLMYLSGEGVPKDYVKAYAWWDLAAAQGDKTAAKGRGQLESIMTAEQFAEAQKLAAELSNRNKKHETTKEKKGRAKKTTVAEKVKDKAPPPAPKPSPIKETYKLQNQKYTVFKVKSSRPGGFVRHTVESYATKARTVEQRRDTVMMAAVEHHMEDSECIVVFSRLWDGPQQKALLARVFYTPAKRGWMNNRYDGKNWSDLEIMTTENPYITFKGKKIANMMATKKTFDIPNELAQWKGHYKGPRQWHD